MLSCFLVTDTDILDAPKKYPPKEFCEFFKNFRKIWPKIVRTDYSIKCP